MESIVEGVRILAEIDPDGKSEASKMAKQSQKIPGTPLHRGSTLVDIRSFFC